MTWFSDLASALWDILLPVLGIAVVGVVILGGLVWWIVKRWKT